MNARIRHKTFLCLVVLIMIIVGSAGCGSTGETPSPAPTGVTDGAAEVNGLLEEIRY